MADQIRAADLPDDSVVVDDKRGLAFYAVDHPGVGDDRWHETGVERGDSTVDYALRNRGARVLRVGNGAEPTQADARERLARHLYAERCAEMGWADLWDTETGVHRAGWYERADELLAVIAGQSTT